MPNANLIPTRSARIALAVLTFINLFNYLDRYVVSALVQNLKESELHLTDVQLGSLVTGFILVYMLTSPIFGALGDRGRRPRLIAAGVAIWSLATALGGLAHSYASLFLARSAVGIGEAAYGTIAPALLADYFPARQRGRVFAIFFCAIPIGSAAGYVAGGLIGQRFGWRNAFFAAGLPGLLLAYLVSRLADPPRGAQEEGPATPEKKQPSSQRQKYRELLKNGPYVLTVLGYAAYTFALGGLAFWTPAFLERVRGVPRASATVQFGAIVVVTGFLGTFLGGWLGDYCLRWTKQSYLWISGISALLAAPAALAAFTVESRPVYMSMIVVAEILIFISTGPVNSAIVNVVAPDARATAVALSIFAIHLFGDVPSPPLIGAISDASSLARAFLIVPVAIAISGIVWIFAAVRGARSPAR